MEVEKIVGRYVGGHQMGVYHMFEGMEARVTLNNFRKAVLMLLWGWPGEAWPKTFTNQLG